MKSLPDECSGRTYSAAGWFIGISSAASEGCMPKQVSSSFLPTNICQTQLALLVVVLLLFASSNSKCTLVALMHDHMRLAAAAGQN